MRIVGIQKAENFLKGKFSWNKIMFWLKRKYNSSNTNQKLNTIWQFLIKSRINIVIKIWHPKSPLDGSHYFETDTELPFIANIAIIW